VGEILCVVTFDTICTSSFDTKCLHHIMETLESENDVKNITLTLQDGVGYMLCVKYCWRPLKLHLMPMPSF